MPISFDTGESCARELDASDQLAPDRQKFHIPKRPDGSDAVYLAGNSLGLQPKAVRAALEQELNDWANMGVDGHFEGRRPWYSYHELLRETGARLVGAQPGEVVMMNSLTVNLHLMMATFYRPTPSRHKILMEDAAFPSDTYAVKTQLLHHDFDPAEALLIARPRPGEYHISTQHIEGILQRQGEEIALVLFPGVHYVTGQLFDLPRIVTAARRMECIVGLDLAHAAGNVPLQLHDWDVDFAVWCNYKYVNSGPGAVGGCFVHERHGQNVELPRLGGWWGNDPARRFRMHLEPDFVPQPGAAGWQVSNPPIFSLAPVRVSYELFDQVGMSALRRKSELLGAYLLYLIDEIMPKECIVITPRDPAERGCQLSLRVPGGAEELCRALKTEGVICDFREPDVLRIAPVPFYNSFHDVWRFTRILADRLRCL